MKKIFIIFSLIFAFSSCKQEVQYYAMFKSPPLVFGQTPVFAGPDKIGRSTGKIEQRRPDLFMLPIKIEKKYSLRMNSNMCAVVVNGVVELRELPNTRPRPLPPDASVTGFCSEWDYNLFVIALKGKQLVEELIAF